jgi:hypothetical protein
LRVLLSILALGCAFSLTAQENTSWEWVRSNDNSQASYGRDVITDNLGNTYAVGDFEGTLSINSVTITSDEYTDVFIAKFNSLGQLLWLKRFGGIGQDNGYGISIDEPGDLYITGSFTDSLIEGDDTLTSLGSADIFLAKYNSGGDLLWSKSWGGTHADAGSGIQITNNRIYITGNFAQTIDFNISALTSSGGSDIFLTKSDTSGVILWAVKAGGSSSEFAGSLTINNKNTIHISGFSGSPIMYFSSLLCTNPDIYVAQYDTNGTPQWVRGVQCNGPLYGGYVASDTSGNAYLAGYLMSQDNVSFGSITLNKSYAFIAKYNPTGSIQWAKEISTANTGDGAYNVAVDSDKNIYVAGYYDFWGVFGSDTVYTHGSWDATVTKLDSNGNHVWSAVGGGGTFDNAYALALDNNGSVVVTGVLASSINYFGPHTINNSGGQNMFVAKLSQTTGLPVIQGNNKLLSVYPNPANGLIYIKGLKKDAEYSIRDIRGLVLQKGLTKNNAIDVKDLPVGMYLLNISNEVHKVVKQ